MTNALYVDSSAALKLYLQDEDGGGEAVAAMGSADLVASRLTQVEVGRSLARAVRDSRLADRVLDSWAAVWRQHEVIELDEAIADHAIALAAHHGLRSLDAIHLASALTLSVPLRFATWDRRLWDAARAVGLRTVPAERP